MAQSMADQLQSTKPRVIKEPPAGLTTKQATHLTAKTTGKAFDDGYYYNTTRVEKGHQYYKYMWRHACAYTKWTPSNQFLHSKRTFDPNTMTLERFGLIGTDKKCYWGLIGVLWKQPLPLGEVKKSPPRAGKKYRTLELGFPGKKVNGERVLQTTAKQEAKDDMYRVDITAKDPKLTGLVNIYQEGTGMLLDVMGDEVESAHMIRKPKVAGKKTQ